MRSIVFIITIILTGGCNNSPIKKEECKNKFDLINCADSISVISFDTLFNNACYKCNNNLESYYKNSTFKTLFNYKGQQYFIKFDNLLYPHCMPPAMVCSPPELVVLINGNNMLLIENEYANVASIDSIFRDYYYLNKGKNPRLSDSPKSSIINLQWDKETSKAAINIIFTKILESYEGILNDVLKQQGKDICTLSNSELLKLKKEYPLNFTIDHDAVPPPPILPESMEDVD